MKTAYYLQNILKNILYGMFPHKVLAYKKPSGRGSNEIESYHYKVFCSYFEYLGIIDIQSYLKDKVIVELGPGNILGTAFYAAVCGAKQTICIDRFPISNIEGQKVYFEKLAAFLPPDLKEKARNMLDNFEELRDRISYYTDLTGRFEDVGDLQADLICSNAVMEHVYDMSSLCELLQRISKKNTLMFHGIDLRSHKMHYTNELDFLDVPHILWKAMTSYRSAPNRLGRKAYSDLFKQNDFIIRKEIILEKYSADTIADYLKNTQKTVSDTDREDLEIAVIGFVCERK